MTVSREENLFGRLALHYKLLTRDQLVDALQQQAREGHRRKIGEILIEKGLLSPQRFQQLMQAQREYEARLQGQGPADESAPGEAATSGPGAGAPGAATVPTAGLGPSLPSSAAPGQPPAALPAAAPALQAAPDLPSLEVLHGDGPSANLLGTIEPALEPSVQGQAAAAPAATPVSEPTSETASQPGTSPVLAAAHPAGAGFDGTMASLLALAVARRASDLHLHAGLPVRLRIDGDFRPLDEPALDAANTRRLLEQVLTADQRQAVEERGQVDLAYTLEGVGRFRANVYRQQRGWDGVFRVIPAEPPSLSDLGLPLDLARFANYHQGLVLITGPTGSGKSSTLAALIRIVNEERRDHIITIEDPVEFVHRPQRCVINQRQVGAHTRSFSRALRAALREDPDVIVVGELRDLETISLALTAAETGHLVLATLHTQNAINTINRLIGVFPAEQQPQIRTMVSESLRAITSQRLVHRADGRGRTAALEVMVANKAVSNLIRENKTFQLRSVMQTGGAQGMKSLDIALDEMVKAGTITRAEAARHAEDPKRFAAKPVAAAPAGAPGGAGAPAARPAAG